MDSPEPPRRASLQQLGAEPFRVFFPAAIVAGVIGVILWPLHLLGIAGPYPGPHHAHLMACGFFGGFILGFIGTALPRMLSTQPLAPWQTGGLVLIHLAMTLAFAFGRILHGDTLFLILLGSFASFMAARALRRKDTPPPGFVLVVLAFACAAVGAILELRAGGDEPDPFWMTVQRLLSYQGFVLLPILGVGPFILPRFFGRPSTHDFPESAPQPPPGWTRKALTALAAGALILASFFLEGTGAFRTAHGLRFAAVLIYLIREVPFHQSTISKNALTLCLRIAFGGLLAGFLAVTLFPGFRVGLLHLTLVGGFAVITLVVATHVAFGHSGNAARLHGRNRWLLVAVGLMLFAMTTRISGDFWPKILASHYSYGAILWAAGLLVWSSYVLRYVLSTDDT